MIFERGSGILMHITSLPGPYGIGDLGQGAYDYIDFLFAAGQRYWQFLPLGPGSVIFDHSPYMSLSAFAGNPLLISPDQLLESGYLTRQDLAGPPVFSACRVEFDKVAPYKKNLLNKAFARFNRTKPGDDFTEFCKSEKAWLNDYSLFMALAEENHPLPWYEWPRSLGGRERGALAAARRRLAERIRYHKFIQFCFFAQWRRMRRYAFKKGIFLIGDIPIYVGLNSADVWSHQDCYMLDAENGRPTHVAGVPPDYFSDTGQRWGNPLYRWHNGAGKSNRRLYSWWRQRFKHIFRMVDIARIDHFRGFDAYWQIPVKEKTAVRGRWVKGPGRRFFDNMVKNLGELPIIAEDLGIITPSVKKLRNDLGFPGMKILQFAFDSDESNAYLPHNFKSSHCVVYTGTHDNDTTMGWFLSPEVNAVSKQKAMRYANSCNDKQIHWDFIRMAFSSVADIAIIPMQDILGLDASCRMNRPSTPEGNWRWRLPPSFLSDEVTQRLKGETEFYGRKRRRGKHRP